jgi:hypothetical protein
VRIEDVVRMDGRERKGRALCDWWFLIRDVSSAFSYDTHKFTMYGLS